MRVNFIKEFELEILLFLLFIKFKKFKKREKLYYINTQIWCWSHIDWNVKSSK